MFDTYVRSAITALVPTPGDDLIGMRIREQALVVWRIVSEDDKKRWKALHEARYSDPHVYKKGRRLLETQGLLAILKPKCQQIIRNASAGQARPSPALPEPTKSSTVPSGDTNTNTSIQSTSDRSDFPPEPALSENTTAAHRESKDTVNAQSASDRSYSPPEFILPKHIPSERTPVTRPVCKDTAIAPSDPSNSPNEFVLPEHTSAAYPRSKDDTDTHTTPDQPPFSPSLEHTTAAHPGSKDNAGTQSTARQSFSSSPEPNLPVPASDSSCKDDASTPRRSSSPPARAVFEHVPVALSKTKDITITKSNYYPHVTPPFPR
jgi:hypothetical protein